jgi:membrane associated rhomboid family serine protease
MLPYKDNIPSRRVPFVNWTIIALNVIVFFYELSLGQKLDPFIYQFGVVPSYVTTGAYGPRYMYLPLITSMFLHAGWLHIAGNMLYLYIFGDNVEDRMGHFFFPFFYLLSGIGAALLQVAIDPSSTIPTVGASGAIAGVMGAYFVLYPKARVRSVVIIFFFIQIIDIPAVFFLGIWFVLQFFSGVMSLGGTQAGGVAFWAHVGGFFVGLFFGLVTRLLTKDRSMEVIATDGRRYWR